MIDAHDMSDFIEFAPLSTGAVHGDGRAMLPALRSKGFEATLTYGGGYLPGLRSEGRQFSKGRSALPALWSKGFESPLNYGGGGLPAVHSFGAGELPFNDLTYGLATLRALQSHGVARAESHGSTPPDGAQLPALMSLGYAGFEGLGYTTANNRTPGLQSAGSQYMTPMTRVSIVQSAGFMRITGGALYGQVSAEDGLVVGDRMATSLMRPYRDRLELAARGTGLIDALDRVTENAAFGDVVHYLWAFLTRELVALADAGVTHGEYLTELADALALHAGGGALVDAQQAVVEAVAFGGSHAWAWPVAVSERVALGDAQRALIEAWHRVLDTVQVAATTGHSIITFAALVREGVALTDNVAALAEMLDTLREGMALKVSVAVDDGVYVGWVFHAGPNAYTSYTNVPFNSVATMPDGRTYAALPDGIYRLEGDDDAGEPIEARIRSGLEAFGTQRMKRLPMMYVGYRTSGDMVLKVVSTSMEGAAREDWYRLERRPADAVRESRVKIGRGLKSAYFGFELVNVDGADFELDSIEFFPVVLERRVN